MSWSALDSLSDSLDASKRLLLPFDLRQWLTLAVIVFFASGFPGSSGFNAGGDTSGTDGGSTGGTGGSLPDAIPVDAVPGAFDPGIAFVLLVVGAFLVLGIALAFIGAVMEFVFVEAARTEQPRVRGVFGEYLRQGAQLFLLRVTVWVLAIGGVVLSLALVVASLGIFLIVLLLASPVLILLGLLVWLFLMFTRDFVVPVMMAEDAGIVSGWRSFWPELRSEWREYAVYAVARVIVGIGAGIVAGMGAVLVGVVLAIPFGIVGVGGYLALESLGLTLAGLVLAGVSVLLFVISFVVVTTTFVQVPVSTYLRYYSLLVLGEVSPQFDLIPEIRADLDDDDDETADGDGGKDDGSGDNGSDDGVFSGETHADEETESPGSFDGDDATPPDPDGSEGPPDETGDDDRL